MRRPLCLIAIACLEAAAFADAPAPLSGALPEDALAAIASGKDSRAGLPEQAAALVHLGRLRHKEALAILAKALEHDDLRIRSAAVRGLAELGDPQAIPALGAALAKPQPVEEQVEYEYPSVDTADETAPVVSRKAQAVATIDRNLELRIQIARSLPAFRSKEAVPFLLEALAAGPDPLAMAAGGSLEIVANRTVCGPDQIHAQTAGAWKAWWEANQGSTRDQWLVAGFAEALGADRVTDLSSETSLEAIATALADERSWIRANAYDCVAGLAEGPPDEGKLRKLLKLFQKLGKGGFATAKESPLQQAARRQFARTFYRLAERWADLKNLPPEQRTYHMLIPGLAPQSEAAPPSVEIDHLPALVRWCDEQLKGA